jgi:hypothetical protein
MVDGGRQLMRNRRTSQLGSFAALHIPPLVALVAPTKSLVLLTSRRVAGRVPPRVRTLEDQYFNVTHFE